MFNLVLRWTSRRDLSLNITTNRWRFFAVNFSERKCSRYGNVSQMAQGLVNGLTAWRPRFDHRPVHVGLVVDL